MASKKDQKNQGASGTQPPVQSSPWYKKTGFVLSALGGVLVTVLTQGPTMLENANELPSMVEQTWGNFQSWRAEDAEWTGVWSAHAEGYVDSVDMALSDTDVRFELKSHEGQVDGMVSAATICKAIPIWNFVLVKGTVSGSKGDLVIFDIVSGRERLFDRLSIHRENGVLVVRPVEDPLHWFPKEARLAKHLGSDRSEDNQARDHFCAPQRAALMVEIAAKKKAGLAEKSQ